MAQPVFNDHPLQDYLRQSGDVFEPIPGALSDLSDHFPEDCIDDPDADLKLWSWLPTPVLRLAKFLNIIVTSVQHRDSTVQEFSERFKYDVISSSLLSSSITTPSSHRRRPSSLPDDSPSDEPDLNSGIQPSSAPLRHPVSHRSPTWSLVLFSLCLISLFFDCFLLCVLIGTALYYIESYTVKPGQLPDFITPTLGALNDLIAAAHLWDSAVHEAINLLELEESTTSSLSPSSPLRVALRSSLQNTQAHSDNVRHVLVGLTSPPALAQLSEMYAPPSPIESRAPLHVRSGSVAVGSRRRTPSTPSSEKRATWNGSIPYSYAALANAGSPSRLSFTRWEKRRSDLSALLGGAIMSAPTTPGPGKSLEGVEEEGGNPVDGAGLSDHEGEADTGVPPEERGLFASAALELQRQRRNRGVEMLFPSARSPLPNCSLFSSQQTPLSTHIARLTNKSSPSGPSSPSSSYPAPRFTAIQVPRHPLSLFSLTLMLNGALAARRYAASHLLALRFEGGDNVEDSDQGNDSYWEDVRAVMGLLTSALANATAPLVEALDASERERLCTENPTPTTPHSRYSSESRSQVSPLYQPQGHRHMGSPVVTSFAPLPSHLSRFAAHVDALTTALNDAREHLGSCVASLRDGPAVTDSNAHANPQDAPALHAYERVRRELGLALRECERGREPLLEILRPPRAAFADDDEDEDEEGVPALGPDAESSDSDKENVAGARSPSPPPFFSISSLPTMTDSVLVEGQHDHREHGVLVVGLERLPPPGIEQVFEADADSHGHARTHKKGGGGGSGDGVEEGDGDDDDDDDDDGLGRLNRPRSILSRAERIAAVKAQREKATLLKGDHDVSMTIPGLGLGSGLDSGVVGGGGGGGGGGGMWRPDGDVVQELKDVIWKVGEQRRQRERRQEEEVVVEEVEEVRRKYEQQQRQLMQRERGEEEEKESLQLRISTTTTVIANDVDNVNNATREVSSIFPSSPPPPSSSSSSSSPVRDDVFISSSSSSPSPSSPLSSSSPSPSSPSSSSLPSSPPSLPLPVPLSVPHFQHH